MEKIVKSAKRELKRKNKIDNGKATHVLRALVGDDYRPTAFFSTIVPRHHHLIDLIYFHFIIIIIIIFFFFFVYSQPGGVVLPI